MRRLPASCGSTPRRRAPHQRDVPALARPRAARRLPSARFASRDIFTAAGIELIEAAADTPQTPGNRRRPRRPADEGRAMPMRLFARREAAGGLLIAAYPREAAAEPDGDAAEIRFARFFQSAPFGIATIGADGRLASTNAAFARMIPDGSNSLGSQGRRRALPLGGCRDARRARGEPEAGARRHTRRGADRDHGRPAEGVLAPRLREPADPDQGRARGGDPLRHRRHRAEGARSQVRAVLEDGGGRQARRRHRPRLQQRADRHHRLLGPAAPDAPSDRPRLQGHQEHPVHRQPRRGPRRQAAGLLAPPDAADRAAAARRRDDRPRLRS